MSRNKLYQKPLIRGKIIAIKFVLICCIHQIRCSYGQISLKQFTSKNKDSFSQVRGKNEGKYEKKCD